MSAGSNISWCGPTWNPTTGCDWASAGCDNCYAMSLARRLKAMEAARITSGRLAVEDAKYQTDGDPRTSGPGFGVATHDKALLLPFTWRKPQFVFVNSMSDLFHPKIPAEFIAKTFIVMALANHHTFQVLTKRTARMRSLLGSDGPDARWRQALNDADLWACGLDLSIPAERFLDVRRWIYGSGDWREPVRPFPNIWLGTSVENQQQAEARIPHLLNTPAAVRWISAEPLIGPVDLSAWMPAGRARWQCSGCHRFYGGNAQEVCPGCGRVGYWTGSHVGNDRPNGQPINWLVAGGESGPGARPMHLDWARRLRDDGTAAGVPFHFKQTGVVAARQLGLHGKGDRFDELPAEFQIRQYPTARCEP